MKKPSSIASLAAVCLFQGCVSRDPARTHEAGGLVVAGVVVTGAVVGVAAAPLALPAASIAGARREAEAEDLQRQYDPIYLSRAETIRRLDPIGDVIRIFDEGRIVFLPSFPDGAFYPGLSRESHDPPKHGLPTKEQNLPAIRKDPWLVEIMRLMADDPSHSAAQKALLLRSDAYRAFQAAASFYKSTFNEAMYRRLLEQRPNKALEPTPGPVTPRALE